MSVDKKRLDELRIERDDAIPRRVPWWIVLIGVLLVAAATVLFARRSNVAVVSVAQATELATEGRATVLNASGYVTARRAATVSSKTTGKVVEVLIEEGIVVSEGDLLARLDDSLIRATYRLAQAQAESARGSLEETRIRINEAKLDFDRAKRLVSENVSSQSSLDRAEAELRSVEARLEVQHEDLSAATRLVAVRAQELADMEIRAPFSGVVVSKDAQPGEMVSPVSGGGGFTRTGICTIVDMASLEIEVDVNESYITRVSKDQPVEAVLDAYPDWRIAAHVITIIPTADRQKATVAVRIGFDERDDRVLPDMGVKVKFIASETETVERRSTVTIPRQALRRQGEQDVVFVVSNGHAERRAIKVGMADGEIVQVASGVTAGESVIIMGPEDLADGDKVRVEAGEGV